MAERFEPCIAGGFCLTLQSRPQPQHVGLGLAAQLHCRDLSSIHNTLCT